MADPSLERFRSVVAGALAHLESRRTEVNDLNVFPVADGDTGDNMVLTLKAVLEELDRLGDVAVDEVGRTEIVDGVARAALLGARGNSGVILSQLIRGAAEELASRPGELVDPVLVSAAMARAADRAYDSVRDPAEGTILTVMREMAHRVASEIAHMADSRLAPDADPEVQDTVLAKTLEHALDAGRQSVERGPDLLPVLREAGVVDAGGFGLLVMFAGVIAALRGAEAPELAHHAPARVTHPEHSSVTYRYCTNFAVTGSALEASRYIQMLEAIGDSVLVVGDRTTLKIHVHTDDPELAMEAFEGMGEVSHLDVADMREQEREHSERLFERNGSARSRAACGAIAVVAGEGMRALFRGLGASTLDGGATMNPSTHELLAGIHEVPAESVIVLPNSPNVIMAAERAAELSEKEVRVIGTRSQQAGLAVAVALDPTRGVESNARAMTAALAEVRTGGVARAARDDPGGRFRRGDAVGYVGEDLTAWGDPEATLAAVLVALSEDAELVTCLAGEDAPLDEDAIALLAPGHVEFEHRDGGQPSWWWLLAAE